MPPRKAGWFDTAPAPALPKVEEVVNLAPGRPLVIPLPKDCDLEAERPRRKQAKRPDPATWPTRWADAFRQVAVKNEVMVHDVQKLLQNAGHVHLASDKVRKICHHMDRAGMPAERVFQVFAAYEDALLEDLRSAFDQGCGDDNRLRFEALQRLVDQLGYTPMPHSLHELLKEARKAAKERMATDDATTFQVFEKLVQLLVARDGFSKTELDELRLAYNRFDLNDSGDIEVEEFKAVLNYLGVCSDPKVTREIESELETQKDPIQFPKFLQLMRKHRAAEYAHTAALFQTYSGDGLAGEVSSGSLYSLFQKLNMTLRPEVLFEVVQDSGLPYQEFTFTNFWKILQVIRSREGLHSSELEETAEVFRRFHPHEKGELLTRSVPHALRWLGYMLSKSREERIDWRKEYGGRSGISLQEFKRVVGLHSEADRQSVRKAFREFADVSGMLSSSRLLDALETINPSYREQEQARGMASLVVPSQIGDQDSQLDFEAFRDLAHACRLAARDRLRDNHGFTDGELSDFRFRFLFHAQDKGLSADDSLPPAACQQLFCEIAPTTQHSYEAREMLKKAVSKHQDKSGGLSLSNLILVMRMYEDSFEKALSEGTPFVKEALGLSGCEAQELLDIFLEYLRNGAEKMQPDDMRKLYYLGRPEGVETLTLAQAMQLRVRMVQLQDSTGCAGNVQQFVTMAKKLREIEVDVLDTEIACKPAARNRQFYGRRASM